MNHFLVELVSVFWWSPTLVLPVVKVDPSELMWKVGHFFIELAVLLRWLSLKIDDNSKICFAQAKYVTIWNLLVRYLIYLTICWVIQAWHPLRIEKINCPCWMSTLNFGKKSLYFCRLHLWIYDSIYVCLRCLGWSWNGTHTTQKRSHVLPLSTLPETNITLENGCLE